MPIKATEGNYRGRPTLTLTWEGGQWEDKHPLNLGISNAKRVMAAAKDIQAFIDRHKNDPRPERPGPTAARGEYQAPPARDGATPAPPRTAPPPRTPPPPRQPAQ